MKRLLFPLLCSLLVVFFVLFVNRATAQTSFEVLQVFEGSNGANPAANLIADRAGNLYGTTEYGGANGSYGNVFRLSPPTQHGGSWTFTVLHTFGSSGDGARPTAPLLLDSAGNLYGTASDVYGDTYGNVFELSPPASGEGEWTETILYNFQGTESDGAYPMGGLVADPSGNLYGTTQTSVFELSPPATQGGQWTFTLLHFFKCCTTDGFSSYAGLVRDSRGNLYGATEMGGFYQTDYCAYFGCGTAFEVSPPSSNGSSWTERVLYEFKSNIGGYSDGMNPFGTLILDREGNLYGNTYGGGALGGGTVFELSPRKDASAPWKETILYNFNYATNVGAVPEGNLVFDKSGNLYGTTLLGGNACIYNATDYGCGVVYELVPNSSRWNENIVASFTRVSGGARFPAAGLYLDDSTGTLYGTTQYGGAGPCEGNPASGCGVVFALKP